MSQLKWCQEFIKESLQSNEKVKILIEEISKNNPDVMSNGFKCKICDGPNDAFYETQKKSITLCANGIFDRVLHRQNDHEKKVVANELLVHELIHAYV
jgi:hypothetical protein